MKSFVSYPFELDVLLQNQSQEKSSGKLVAHYELLKKVIGLKGSIIKCGISTEEGFARLTLFRDILGSKYTQRMIAFQKSKTFFEEELNEIGEVVVKVKTRNCDVKISQLEKTMIEKGLSQNIDFVPGDVCNTIPEYLIENPELKIAMLNVDLDDYEGTMNALEFLYPRIVQGGVLILDNYYKNMGERKAFEEYFWPSVPKINCFSVNKGPHYIVKQ